MKTFRFVVVAFLLLTAASPAQTRRREPAPVPDAASVESIVAALYASLSHAPGAAPDFERLRTIFLYVGMVVPPTRRASGEIDVSDVDGLADRYRANPTHKEGLSEREIARRTDCFGNVCQVFSTYEARHLPSDPKPFERGIQSIQLVRDGRRWWIASVAWDVERPETAIPPPYLPEAKS
jgi:hypothetical protein